MEVINGTRFSDNLLASLSMRSKVLGLGGNDTLGHNGSDQKHILDGGDGNDRIVFGRSTIKALGGDGDDTLDSNHNAIADKAYISGGKGNDSILYRATSSQITKAQRVVIDGGPGNDTITFYGNDNIINPKIKGGRGNDVIALTLSSFDALEYVKCGAGDDEVILYTIPVAKKTYLYGGKGVDKLFINTFDRPKISNKGDEVVLSFAAYTLDGRGYQQKIIMSGFEILKTNSLDMFI